MSAARTIIGNYCFKKSTYYILKKTNLLDTKQFICYASVKFLNKIITNKIPDSIILLFQKINKRAMDNKLRPLYKPKTAKLSKHIIYKASNIINQLPNHLKNIPIKVFTKKLKVYLQSNCMWDVGDQCNDDSNILT